MTVRIVPLDPADDDLVDRWVQLCAAARAVDRPLGPPVCPRDFVGGLTVPWPGSDDQDVVAVDGDVVVGWAQASLPTMDNLDHAVLDAVVHPQWRGRGVGRALSEHLGEAVRGSGRTTVLAETVQPLDGTTPAAQAAAALLESYGAKPALGELESRLDLAAMPAGTAEALRDEASTRADGYEVELWRDGAPETAFADLGRLEATLTRDAPSGDLAWQPEVYDDQRWRDTLASFAARGMRTYWAAARHQQSGELVGYTLLVREATTPEWLHQWATVVEPAHRGHRLGLLIKAANLLAARAYEPQARWVVTGNAAENTHMLAVNRRLGFSPVERWTEWQLRSDPTAAASEG